MAIRKVARLGHPVLRRVADPIDPVAVCTPAVQALLQDLLDTVEEYDGAGLAAPQIHESVRAVVLAFDEEGMRTWINPVLTPLTEELAYSFEGCLSVPGLRGLVGRPSRVRVQALDGTGRSLDFELDGFAAVVAQHECDHLDGVVYVDRVEPETLAFDEELRKHGLPQVGAFEEETESLEEA